MCLVTGWSVTRMWLVTGMSECDLGGTGDRVGLVIGGRIVWHGDYRSLERMLGTRGTVYLSSAVVYLRPISPAGTDQMEHHFVGRGNVGHNVFGAQTGGMLLSCWVRQASVFTCRLLSVIFCLQSAGAVAAWTTRPANARPPGKSLNHCMPTLFYFKEKVALQVYYF